MRHGRPQISPVCIHLHGLGGVNGRIHFQFHREWAITSFQSVGPSLTRQRTRLGVQLGSAFLTAGVDLRRGMRRRQHCAAPRLTEPADYLGGRVQLAQREVFLTPLAPICRAEADSS